MNPSLYPLLSERRIVQPIWGGSYLAAWLALDAPHPERLGETWQVFDTNPVTNGPLAGQTLADLTQAHGAALVGTRTTARYGADFPLLAKFIDAGQQLSIQVHPDDTYAHRQEAATGFHGKTEAWYILHAAPGATVTYGLSQPSSRADFADAITSGTVEQLMNQVPVRAGDVVFVPAGTMHAINAGIVLFEIQQKSDLTYRVYDYNRRDAKTGQLRELHVEKSLDVMEYGAAQRGIIPPAALADGRELLIACSLFALERWTLTSTQAAHTDPGTFETFTVIAGSARLEWDGQELVLERGVSVVLPASLGAYALAPHSSSSETPQLLRACVPDLARDLVAPLAARGLDAATIAQTVIA